VPGYRSPSDTVISCPSPPLHSLGLIEVGLDLSHHSRPHTLACLHLLAPTLIVHAHHLVVITVIFSLSPML